MFQVGAENCVLRIARGTELQIVEIQSTYGCGE